MGIMRMKEQMFVKVKINKKFLACDFICKTCTKNECECDTRKGFFGTSTSQPFSCSYNPIYFIDTERRKILHQCHPDCASCTSFKSNECKTCPEHRKLDENNNCYCDKSEKFTFNSKGKCECDIGFKFFNNKCIDDNTFTKRNFVIGEEGLCKDYTDNTLACNGISNCEKCIDTDTCCKCKESHLKNYFVVPFSYTCGFDKDLYPKTNSLVGEGRCTETAIRKCGPHCVKCLDNLTTCCRCKAGYRLTNTNTCVSNCDDTDGTECDISIENCEKCKNSIDTICCKCDSGHILDVKTNTCASNSNTPIIPWSSCLTYENPVECETNCKYCIQDSPTICCECKGYYQISPLYKCEYDLEKEYYTETTTTDGTVCNILCSTCSENYNPWKCKACNTGFNLVNFADGSKTCHCEDKLAYYDVKTNKCKCSLRGTGEGCHESCLSCSGTASNNCDSCYDWANKKEEYPSSKKCEDCQNARKTDKENFDPSATSRYGVCYCDYNKGFIIDFTNTDGTYPTSVSEIKSSDRFKYGCKCDFERNLIAKETNECQCDPDKHLKTLQNNPLICKCDSAKHRRRMDSSGMLSQNEQVWKEHTCECDIDLHFIEIDGKCVCDYTKNYIQDHDTGICRCDYVNGYKEIGGACIKCHATCKECSGFSINDCTECYPFLEQNRIASDASAAKFKCVCQKNTYIDLFPSNQITKCQPCHYSCFYCIDTADKCTRCQTGRGNSTFSYDPILNENVTIYQPINNTCPCRFNTTNVGVSACEACPVGCNGCTSNFSIAENKYNIYCLDCMQERELINGKCPCTDGKTDVNGACVGCHYTCQNCNATGEFGCVTCNGTGHHRELFSSENGTQCVCKTGFKDYQGKTICEDISLFGCHYSCASCINGSHLENMCKTCNSTFLRHLENQRCVCNDGFYDAGEKMCQKCHYTCKTCTGGDYSECVTCDKGRGDDKNNAVAGVCGCFGNTYDNLVDKCLVENPLYSNIRGIISLVNFISVLLFFLLLAGGKQKYWFRFIDGLQFANMIFYINMRFSLNFGEYVKLVNIFFLEFLPNPFYFMLVSFGIIQPGYKNVIILKGQEAPTKFNLNGKVASFLVNGGGIISINILAWLSLGLTVLFAKRYNFKENHILQRYYGWMKWCGIFRIILMSFLPVSMYIFLQFGNIKLETPTSFMSLGTSCIFIWYYVSMLIAITKIVNLTITNTEKAVIDKYKSLIESQKTETFLERNYVVVLLVKKLLLCCFMVSCYLKPNTQIFGSICVFGFSLIYTILIRPYKKKKYFLLQVFCDSCFIALYIIALFHINTAEERNEDLIYMYGLAMIILFCCIYGANFIFLIFNTIINARYFFISYLIIKENDSIFYKFY